MSLKNYLFLIFTLILTACTSGEKLAAIPKASTVLILGDSLSYGTGASPETSYPTLLAKHTGWDIVNTGIPGNTTAQGLARLPDLIESHQPKYLFVELGGNDFLQSINIQTTETNLRAIIQMAKDHNIPVLLIAIPDFKPVKAAFGGLDDHVIYQKIAQETQTPLVENIFSDVLGDNALKADYVHPNAQGYQVVEANLMDALMTFGLVQ